MARQTPTSSYAIVWQHRDDVASGGLQFVLDGLDLHARETRVSIPFAHIVDATIRRDPKSRLRGLPVLALQLHDGALVKIASLEGIGALHELAARMSQATVSPVWAAGPSSA